MISFETTHLQRTLKTKSKVNSIFALDKSTKTPLAQDDEPVITKGKRIVQLKTILKTK